MTQYTCLGLTIFKLLLNRTTPTYAGSLFEVLYITIQLNTVFLCVSIVLCFLNQLYCRFISVTIRPACHNPIPSHLVLPPYAAAQQEHSGHKYEN